MNETKKKAANKLKTARGQLDGIIKMVEEVLLMKMEIVLAQADVHLLLQ